MRTASRRDWFASGPMIGANFFLASASPEPKLFFLPASRLALFFAQRSLLAREAERLQARASSNWAVSSQGIDSRNGICFKSMPTVRPFTPSLRSAKLRPATFLRSTATHRRRVACCISFYHIQIGGIALEKRQVSLIALKHSAQRLATRALG
ncbi:hypothetical protein MRB53_038393 [Persea americana]|nr:hypothetical protein MRB53_038393 [Persea americana]